MSGSEGVGHYERSERASERVNSRVSVDNGAFGVTKGGFGDCGPVSPG